MESEEDYNEGVDFSSIMPLQRDYNKTRYNKMRTEIFGLRPMERVWKSKEEAQEQLPEEKKE